MKICIIKLGAKGDVIRTMPIALALKKKHEKEGCEIIWITRRGNDSLLKNNKNIDKIELLPYNNKENFDALYNFDSEDEAIDLANEIKAKEKYGFYCDGGYPAAFNAGAEYYLNTMFDDNLKKNNKLTYQRMMFNAAELAYENEICPIVLTNDEIKYGKEFIKKNELTEKRIIGLHMGSSPRWPSKTWTEEKILEFIEKCSKKYNIILFAGPNEKEKQKEIISKLKAKKIEIYANNTDNTDREFASLLNICDVIVCSDSFALHVSLALGKKTIALFFCTSPDEVEGYSLLKKIVSPKLYEFFPERSNEDNEELRNSITSHEVFREVEKLLDKKE